MTSTRYTVEQRYVIQHPDGGYFAGIQRDEIGESAAFYPDVRLAARYTLGRAICQQASLVAMGCSVDVVEHERRYPAGSLLEAKERVYGSEYARQVAEHHEQHHGQAEPDHLCGLVADGPCGECGCPVASEGGA